MKRLDRICASSVLAGLVVIAATVSPHVAAETARVEWVGQTPTIEKVGEVSAEEYNPMQGNLTCDHLQEVRVKYDLWQDSVSMGCLVPLQNGYLDISHGQMLRYGEKYNFILTDDIWNARLATEYSMYPAANTDTVAFHGYLTGDLSVTTKFSQLFSKPSLDWKKQVSMNRVGDYDFTLSNEPGKPVPWAMAGTINYSRNGKWMIVSTRDQANLRINLETFEIFPFAQPVGLSHATTQAVSNDGRFVAVFQVFTGLDIYDLEKCGPATGKLENRNCQAMHISATEINERFSADTVWAKMLQFDSDSQLSLYVAHAKGEVTSYGRYTIRVPAVEQPVRYLALGDSFSSGEGAYKYSGETNYYFSKTNFNICHNSSVAYPNLLNVSLKAPWFASVACSGAVDRNIVSNVSDKSYINKYSQAFADIGDTSINGYISQTITDVRPGYLPQLSMVAAHRPSVATITIGGNDIGFSSIIQSCILQAGCFSDRDDREAKADEIAQKILSLTTTFGAILANMGGNSPRLYVVGYPKITSPDHHSCSLIGYDERQRADALVDYLNESIKIAAHNAGAIYVDTSDAFVDYSKTIDYRICGTKDVRLAVNGALPALAAFQNGSSYPTDQIHANESYHPNMLGHLMMAEKVRTVTDDLRHPFMYRSGRPIRPSEATYTRFVGDAFDNLNVSQSYQRMTYAESAKRGSQVQLEIPANQQLLPSLNGSATVELHSEPIVLAVTAFDPTKDQSLQVTVPESVPAGYHTLHVVYNDISGSTVDLYQYLYVVAADNDYDGDGVLNNDEACVIGGVLGADYDADGVDDACDPDEVEPVKEDASTHESGKTGGVDEKTVAEQAAAETVIHPIAQTGALAAGTAQNNNTLPGLTTEGALRTASRVAVPANEYVSLNEAEIVLGDATNSHLENAGTSSSQPLQASSVVKATSPPQQSTTSFWLVGGVAGLLLVWVMWRRKNHKRS